MNGTESMLMVLVFPGVIVVQWHADVGPKRHESTRVPTRPASRGQGFPEGADVAGCGNVRAAFLSAFCIRFIASNHMIRSEPLRSEIARGVPSRSALYIS